MEEAAVLLLMQWVTGGIDVQHRFLRRSREALHKHLHRQLVHPFRKGRGPVIAVRRLFAPVAVAHDGNHVAGLRSVGGDLREYTGSEWLSVPVKIHGAYVRVNLRQNHRKTENTRSHAVDSM